MTRRSVIAAQRLRTYRGAAPDSVPYVPEHVEDRYGGRDLDVPPLERTRLEQDPMSFRPATGSLLEFEGRRHSGVGCARLDLQ